MAFISSWHNEHSKNICRFNTTDSGEFNMKLSEQLKQDNDCGDFGNALNGYSERAKAIEDSLEYIDSYLENVVDFISEDYNFSADGLKKDVKDFLLAIQGNSDEHN